MFDVFAKKSVLKSGILRGMVDVHSHILPGVDDGSQDMKHSRDLCAIYQDIGITRVFCTPHVKSSMPGNTTLSLTDSFNQFSKEEIGIEVRLAAEYMLDENFPHVIADGKMLSYDGEHILVEINRHNKLSDIYEMLFEIMVNGYTPILAHPERYLSLSCTDVLSLKERGVLFQLNMPSLTNYYGSVIAQRACAFFEEEVYDFVATDFHDMSQFEYISSLTLGRKDKRRMEKLIEKNSSLWTNVL